MIWVEVMDSDGSGSGSGSGNGCGRWWLVAVSVAMVVGFIFAMVF